METTIEEIQREMHDKELNLLREQLKAREKRNVKRFFEEINIEQNNPGSYNDL